MAQITIKIIENRDEWELFLEKKRETNFLQSWYWGEFHKNLGHQIHRTGFYDGDKLTGVMLSVVEPAKRGKYLTIPGGPIIDWDNTQIVESFVEEIKKIAKNHSCVFVRVRPQLESNEFSRKIFKQNGFLDAPVHLHAELTSQLDITKSEEELLAQMRKTTRYEIRKAISQNITINSTKDSTAIKQFYELQLETSKRQNFVPFSYQYLHEQFKVFAKENLAILLSAELNNKLLAQAFIIYYGQEAVYHYGASTEEGRKFPGAYLIQWEAIKEAKTRGMKHYNFWGVAPEQEKRHRFYGLSVFKRGFGGTDFTYLHAQDLVINKSNYFVNLLVETARKKIRRI